MRAKEVIWLLEEYIDRIEYQKDDGPWVASMNIQSTGATKYIRASSFKRLAKKVRKVV